MQQVIDYWDKQPCNIKHSNKEIGTMAYFEEVSQRKYFVESHIPAFADFESYKNKRVLEIGCGIGTAAISFLQAGAIYTGIDISKKSIEIAKQRLQLYGHSPECVKEGNIEEYEDDTKYDLVYSFGVLHHTLDINKSVDIIKNLLVPNGTFKLMLYAKNSWKYFKIVEGLDQYEAQSGVPIANVYTKDEIFDLLKNYTDIEIVQDHIFPYKIDKYKQYIYEKEDYFSAMPDDLFRCLEKNLGFHLCITCKNRQV